MPKSKRLIELIMAVNRKRTFTVKELAREFGVSSRTMQRDLQELSELGVPLYAEVGPHGGYRVLNERMLPPIAFTEEEAVAIFFASHALRHYVFLPFAAEISSVLSKFYSYMPADVRERIDQMRHRVDFRAPTQQTPFPHLALLLHAAIRQQTLAVEYESPDGSRSTRRIQPVGIYASNGLWYCPAYCLLRKDFRLFRCDRIHDAVPDPVQRNALDLAHIHLDNWEDQAAAERRFIRCQAELTREGVERCRTDAAWRGTVNVREDGTGWLDGAIPCGDLTFFAKYFIGMGNEVTVVQPPELIASMKALLRGILAKYE
ncbi:YafY family transcriptional regulator [Paenibacillus athensensis]|uniref:Transcriptional regulator n=1 Tax=Paenibacillus athensensis TaxID=1967502 RepID=A0A4Y8PYX7_9BACL|nr:YafY family protein [Paenibacillus athensensis]MCD1260432.1 YafY family transcriptional regulator [Paenibacillus athensensis]